MPTQKVLFKKTGLKPVEFERRKGVLDLLQQLKYLLRLGISL